MEMLQIYLVAAMDKTGTLAYANTYIDTLRSSLRTIRIQELRHICLLTLLEDILAGDMKTFALADKAFWIKFLNKCFPFLHFETEDNMKEWYVYIGTGEALPENGTDLVKTSVRYNLLDPNIRSNGIVTQRITGRYFWIATAGDHEVESIDNTNFQGDFLTISDNFFRTPGGGIPPV